MTSNQRRFQKWTLVARKEVPPVETVKLCSKKAGKKAKSICAPSKRNILKCDLVHDYAPQSTEEAKIPVEELVVNNENVAGSTYDHSTNKKKEDFNTMFMNSSNRLDCLEHGIENALKDLDPYLDIELMGRETLSIALFTELNEDSTYLKSLSFTIFGFLFITSKQCLNCYAR